MASGSWTTYVRDSTHEYMQVSYSGTGNASSNSTPLTVTIKFYAPYSISVSSRTLTVAIDGTTHTLTTPSISQGWTTLGTVSQTVGHSSNGSKSCSINVTYPFKATLGGTYYGNVTSNNTATLDNIPRKATINSAPNFTSDQNPSITFSNPGGFVINARMEFGGTNINRTSIANTGSFTFSLSTDERNLLFSKCTSSNTLTVRFVIATKINSSSETDWTWLDRTMTVQSGIPTFTSITSERIDGTVPSSWGIYVKGKSKCKLTINGASGIYGSSISGYSISGGGYIGSTSPYTTGFLNTSGTVTFSGKVIDSRPNRESSTKTTSIYVYDYSTPSISSITTNRCNSSGTALDDGTYIKVKCDFTYSSCNSKNTVTATVRYKRSGTDSSGNAYSWSSSYLISDNTEVIIGSGLINVDYAYDIEYKVVDYFGVPVYRYDMVMSSFSIMDFKPGGAGVAGVAIGKSATVSNLFDVGMPTRIQTLNGIVKATSGTLGEAIAGTDYVAPSYFSQATPVDLTMINGAASQGWYCQVYKCGNIGMVILAITVSSTQGIANNTTIANLPTGYYAWQPAMVNPSGNASNTGAIGVINGIVRVSGILAKGSYTCCIPYIIA